MKGGNNMINNSKLRFEMYELLEDWSKDFEMSELKIYAGIKLALNGKEEGLKKLFKYDLGSVEAFKKRVADEESFKNFNFEVDSKIYKISLGGVIVEGDSFYRLTPERLLLLKKGVVVATIFLDDYKIKYVSDMNFLNQVEVIFTTERKA